LALNYGTLYPALLRLEQEGFIEGSWGLSHNNRRARFYSLTKSGKRQLSRETRAWADTSAIIGLFLAPNRGRA
jgi:DNA-binding PadR family transcriptional regulator